MITSQGERSRTANPKIHDRTVLIAFSADCLHFLCLWHKANNRLLFMPSIRTQEVHHQRLDPLPGSIPKRRFAMKSIEKCGLCLIQMSLDVEFRSFHRAKTAGPKRRRIKVQKPRAGRRKPTTSCNPLGKKIDSTHVRMHRSYPPVIQNGDGGNPRRKLSHMVGFSTSSVSTKTWVIFQKAIWSWWHLTVNMKLLDILLYSTMIL